MKTPVDTTDLLKKIHEALQGKEPVFWLTREATKRDRGMALMEALREAIGLEPATVKETRAINLRSASDLDDSWKGRTPEDDLDGTPVDDSPPKLVSPAAMGARKADRAKGVSTSAPAVDKPTEPRARPQDIGLLDYFKAHPETWLGRGDILKFIKLSTTDWNIQINGLLSTGAVERTGIKKGCRYRLI